MFNDLNKSEDSHDSHQDPFDAPASFLPFPSAMPMIPADSFYRHGIFPSNLPIAMTAPFDPPWINPAFNTINDGHLSRLSMPEHGLHSLLPIAGAPAQASAFLLPQPHLLYDPTLAPQNSFHSQTLIPVDVMAQHPAQVPPNLRQGHTSLVHHTRNPQAKRSSTSSDEFTGTEHRDPMKICILPLPTHIALTLS